MGTSITRSHRHFWWLFLNGVQPFLVGNGLAREFLLLPVGTDSLVRNEFPDVAEHHVALAGDVPGGVDVGVLRQSFGSLAAVEEPAGLVLRAADDVVVLVLLVPDGVLERQVQDVEELEPLRVPEPEPESVNADIDPDEADNPVQAEEELRLMIQEGFPGAGKPFFGGTV